MANLILNGKGPQEDPDTEKSYEFDPGDGTILEEILALLSRRKNEDRESIEKLLAALCAASMEKKQAANTSKAALFIWPKSIKGLFYMLKKINQTRGRGKTGVLKSYPC